MQLLWIIYSLPIFSLGCSYGAKGQRYKLFWMGGEEKLDGVGIFVAEKWVDSVVSKGTVKEY